MDEIMVTARVNAFIKRYLKETGKRQNFVALELGYDPQKFSQLINGRKPMKVGDLSKICNYFHVSASEFIPLDEQQNKPAS